MDVAVGAFISSSSMGVSEVALSQLLSIRSVLVANLNLNDSYCPYCYYKQAVVTVLQIQQLREKAMVAKKTLLNAVGTNAERWGS